jgi:hypothetical protein
MKILASYDPKAEAWVGEVEGTSIHNEAATLDDLLAKLWARIRAFGEDHAGGYQLIVNVGEHEASLLETLHLMRSPANAERLNEALADIAAGRVIKRDL